MPTRSLFTRIFGDTPTEMIINGLVLAVLFYIVWVKLLRPLLGVIKNVREVFVERELKSIELIPPAQSEIDPAHSENLMGVMQRIGERERLALEVVGSKKKGIRYRVVAESYAVDSIKKQLSSYLPDFKFKVLNAAPKQKEGSAVYALKQSRHFAFPLKRQDQHDRADPMSFIAGSMTQLEDDEEVGLQLVLRPYSSKKVNRIYNQIINNGRTVIDQRLKNLLVSNAWIWAPSLLVWLLFSNAYLGLLCAIVLWVSGLFMEKKEKPLSTTEEKIFGDIVEKLDQHLMRTDIRFSVYSPHRSNQLVDDFAVSLQPLNKPGYQAIWISKNKLGSRGLQYLSKMYINRLASVLERSTSILSAHELASLFHFPYGVIKTEGMIRSHSKTLPAPLSLKDDPDLDVVFGVNKHHDNETPIGLTKDQRERHMYIIGGTGSGKTTMLKYQIIQDIQNGKGVAVVDPHGDLAEELLEFVPKGRKKDLIYLNPDDLDHPLGVNLLEMPDGLTGNDLLKEKDRVTESVISVMRKIFSEDDSGGHRIEYILRNTVQTALTTENPTIFTIYRLLNDGKYAKKVIDQLKDEDLQIFWRNEMGKAGSMQKVKMAAGITSKIGRFLFSASAKAVLGKERSDIDFNEVLNGKILICNFSKGKLGEDTSMLFGTTILAKLQLAALKRSEQKQTNRKPFYLYIDEFQNFASVSFTQMLSEARKYKVYLTMAEQSTQQQEDQQMIEIILANVGTVVAFRTGSAKDEQLMLPKFQPYIEEGEISNLPAYNFYCRISGIETSEPMSGETIQI